MNFNVMQQGDWLDWLRLIYFFTFFFKCKYISSKSILHSLFNRNPDHFCFLQHTWMDGTGYCDFVILKWEPFWPEYCKSLLELQIIILFSSARWYFSIISIFQRHVFFFCLFFPTTLWPLCPPLTNCWLYGCVAVKTTHSCFFPWYSN